MLKPWLKLKKKKKKKLRSSYLTCNRLISSFDFHFPGGSVIKNPLQETQETRVQSLSQEDPLEEEMATHSSITAWEIPWTEEPGRLQSSRLQRVGRD